VVAVTTAEHAFGIPLVIVLLLMTFDVIDWRMTPDLQYYFVRISP